MASDTLLSEYKTRSRMNICRLTAVRSVVKLLSVTINPTHINHIRCSPLISLLTSHTFVQVRSMSVTGNLLSWKITADDIKTSADELIVKTKAAYDTVGLLKPEEVNYRNVVKVQREVLHILAYKIDIYYSIAYTICWKYGILLSGFRAHIWSL